MAYGKTRIEPGQTLKYEYAVYDPSTITMRASFSGRFNQHGGNMASDVQQDSGVWEVWFVISPGEGEARDSVWTTQVVSDDRNAAVAIATTELTELDEEAMKRLKHVLVRKFVG
jgi:hypothetical protein